MLPYNPWLAFLSGLVLTVIPIATTYPGLEVPAWVGLGLALLSAAAAYLLKAMAPADDVHKDSELPAPMPPVIDYALLADELEKARQARVQARLQKVAND